LTFDGAFLVPVGINFFHDGLHVGEVSLIANLDADQELHLGAIPH
jgi:excinuclease UvrABC helicase subunit UvrB